MGITVWRSLPYALYALSKTTVDQHINTLDTLISHSWQTYEIFHFSSHLWSNGRWWSGSIYHRKKVMMMRRMAATDCCVSDKAATYYSKVRLISTTL